MNNAVPRAWGDCPRCCGDGDSADPIQGAVQRRLPRIPCPTCASHFLAVDTAVTEAVEEMREQFWKYVAVIDNMGVTTDEDWEWLAVESMNIKEYFRAQEKKRGTK